MKVNVQKEIEKFNAEIGPVNDTENSLIFEIAKYRNQSDFYLKDLGNCIKEHTTT